MNLSIEHITKRFTQKGTAAVLDASFDVPSGGITTLLGPSGSGKTTLLRIVAGLETADEGRVVVDGVDITRTPVGQRHFGFVFQSFALFPHMSVHENIAFGLRAQGARGPQVAARVDELLGLVRLDGLGGRYPAQLSGGQRQRVGFARALAPYPKVLLLDEPFGALDARVRLELRAFLRELHTRTKITTILVTHDQDEALELSDQLVVMDKGHIHQVAAPGVVYDHPQTEFVASFVGTANILSGAIQNGRAHVGSLSVAAPDHLPEGANVRAIVRPHDIRVSREGKEAGRTLGTVIRILGVGGAVKLRVLLPSEGIVDVELPKAEAEALALAAGDKVVVDVGRAKVFVQDYAI